MAPKNKWNNMVMLLSASGIGTMFKGANSTKRSKS